MKTRADELRRQRNAISDGFKSAAPEERPALGQQAKAIGAEISALEAGLGDKQAALDALLLRVPNIPWEGAPVGPDETFNTVVRREGEPPELRFRAARPCRPGREERLGRPRPDHPGRRIAHLLPEGAARPARAGADALGAEAAGRRTASP